MMTFRPIRHGTPFLVLVLTMCAFAPAPAGMAQEPFKVTTVFLVRHAEKLTTPPGDPGLTARGKTRALSLARILMKARIKSIFTSQFVRTKATAQPLADALRLESAVVPIESDPADPNKVSEQSIKNLVDRINQHPEGAVLVVGHTNTIPQIIAMLGGDPIANIAETEFDNLYIVTIYQKAKASVVQLKY